MLLCIGSHIFVNCYSNHLCSGDPIKKSEGNGLGIFLKEYKLNHGSERAGKGVHPT